MYLLTSKSVLTCSTRAEKKMLLNEIDEFQMKLLKVGNYDCIVVREFKDPAHKRVPVVTSKKKLHSVLFDILEEADTHTGADLLADETREFLVLLAFGTNITYENKTSPVVCEYRSFPYDGNGTFLNVVDFMVSGMPIMPSQYKPDF